MVTMNYLHPLKNISTSKHYSNLENMQILNRIRLIAINGQLALILFSVWYLAIRLPIEWLFSLLLFEIVFQGYCYQRAKQSRRITSNEILLSIIVDSLILAGLVYFSGGASNPFIYLLLLPLALGTLMLTPRNLLLVAALQLLLYSLLNIYQRPLELSDTSPLASFHLHLMGMWVNFIMTVILIAVFGLLTRSAMLKQGKKIQSLREKQLKDEQILGLGIMSASAAHELGTPLATMEIIVDDLKHQNLPDNIKEDMGLLATQINKCREIIRGLNDKSNLTKSRLTQQNDETETSSKEKIKKQLQNTIENWLVYRPQMIVKQSWNDEIEALNYALPISVEQALSNLLDNAADASLANQNDQLEIKGYCQAQQIIIDIIDHGAGITLEQKQSLGASIYETDKKDGLGWGLFLSNASIERAGGKVELMDSAHGGTLTRISLPVEERI